MNSVGVNLGEFRCSEALKAYNKALMDYKKLDWHTNPGYEHDLRNAVRQAKRAVQRAAGAEEELVSEH